MNENGLMPTLAPLWIDANFPPGSKHCHLPEHKICPFFGQIVEAAQLLGKTREDVVGEREYCGKLTTILVDDVPTCRSPSCACLRTAKELVILIQQAEKTIKYPLKVFGGKLELHLSGNVQFVKEQLNDMFQSIEGLEAIEKLRKNTGVIVYRDDRTRQRTDKEVIIHSISVLNKLMTKALGIKYKTEEAFAFIFMNGRMMEDGCKQAPKY